MATQPIKVPKHTFQVNFKFINDKGQIRSAAVAISADTQDEAKTKGLEIGQAMYGPTTKVTTVTLW